MTFSISLQPLNVMRWRMSDMSCSNPLTINVKGRAVSVPCRYCMSCRTEYQSALLFGAKHELLDCYRAGLGASFVTLTYSDANLPENGSLRKKDVQNLLKNVRIQAKRKTNLPPFKYIMCGEYGDKFGRPHYHIVFIGLSDILVHNFVKPLWKFGLVDIGVLREGGLRYALKYCTKAARGKKAEELYDNQNIERPFICHSRGIGKNWFVKNADDIIAHNFTYLENGIRKPLPVYFRRQYDVFKAFDVSEAIKYLSEEAKMHGYDDYRDWSKQKAYQTEKNLTAAARASGIPVDDSSLRLQFGFTANDYSPLVNTLLAPRREATTNFKE
ncbi:replication initiation protein [Tortoise microvirus 54]|nr:replication initiation protein [Tortoise microvirus 54]